MCEFSIFGSPALVCNGRSRHIPRRKARALLTYLAVTRQSHSREALVALLWSEHDRRAGHADLSRILSSLRKTLGSDYFLADRERVALNEEVDLGVDVVRFRRLLDKCRKKTEVDEDCRQNLVAAVDLYQADFLAGFTLPDSPDFDEWQLLQTEALRRDLGWAVEKLTYAYEARNDLTQAIAYAHRWVGLDSLHEPAQHRLIALYARNGQLAEAHRQYLAFERLLAKELGVEPQPETKRLHEQLRSGSHRTPLIANRFQLIEKEEDLLGQGSIGDVYRGLDTKLDRPVAIKVARPGVISKHPELLDLFVREGNALRQLDHPNIVKMIDTVVEHGRHFLVMEYIRGDSLQTLLARHEPFPLPRVLEIGLGLADALARAHQMNIIHRDLKPANVLLAEDGAPRLTDFGLARLGDASQLSRRGAVLDTIGYLSPEACQGDHLDARSDIWSLGVLLVEMLTGERPFEGNTLAETIAAILNQPAPDLRQHDPPLPAPLINLIGRMLIKDRDKRLPSMRLVGAELEALQQGRSASGAALGASMEPEIRFFFSHDGTRIAYATVGTGPPLVMTATFLRHLEFEWRSPIWQHWLETLARLHTLIRYDERACGLSDWNVSDISFEAWVGDLEALVDHLGLERFRLLALSQGGAVAIAYAARHPDKVSHLILHGAYARGRNHRDDDPQASEVARTMLSLTKLGWGRENPAFRRVFSMQLMPDATDEQLAWYDELMRASMTPDNAARAEEVMYNINVIELLPEIRVPTLVTHCRADEAVPFTEGRILASQIPGARFVPLDSKNHLLLPSEPAWDQFVQELHRFVGTEFQALLGSTAGRKRAPLKIPRFDGLDSPTEREHLFVTREKELARLGSYLDEMLAGNGQVAFITGGAGRGKTSLLGEFALRAQKAHSDLIVAGGNGNSLGGIGDPYMPFREVMSSLTGDVAARRTGEQMRVEQARRLWALLPITTQTILEHGPQLLDVFVPGKGLLARAEAAAPGGASWLASLQGEIARRQKAPGSLEQTSLFGQFTSVLHHLSQKHPLLITLDDLQWIDQASIGLLFQLGRRLTGSRILIIGTYRTDELLPGRNGEAHPLVQVLDEFKRVYGDVFIDLAKNAHEEGRTFVDAYLDAEPNQLDGTFRQALFQRTGGHPLFTVELLRDMQGRGDLFQDETGSWCQGQELDWETVPARVEAVIARRVDRLDEASRAILSAASVEGELFTAEVVSRVLGLEERTLLHSLSEGLGKRHRLVREQTEAKVGRRYLTRYQFNHVLFQEYVYRQLSAGERRRLHKAVAGALAILYEDDLDQVVVQLADHFAAAAEWDEAVRHQIQAGDLAYQKASLPDAVRHYRSALSHWSKSDPVGQAEILRKLGECLWVLDRHQEAVETLQTGYELSQHAGDNPGTVAAQRLLGMVYWELGEPEKAEQSHTRALTLSESEPESEERAWALAGMSNFQMHIENWDESIRLGEQALALARSLGVDSLVIQCLCDLGSALSSKGDWDGLAMEKESLELALTLNRPHDAGRGYVYFGEGLLYLGDYEQAREVFEQAITYTRRMNISYITDAALRMLVEVEWLNGDWSAALTRLKPLFDRFLSGQLPGTSKVYLGITLGRVYNDLGLLETAQSVLKESLASIKSSSTRTALLGELLRTAVALGHPETAVAAVDEILAWTVQARYLFPNINMALLYICSLPAAFGMPEMAGAAHTAWQQLERLDEQYHTRGTAASRLEGQGWVMLASGDAVQAAACFEQAVALWADLGHPYDQARSLRGLSQALTLAGNNARAMSVSGKAKDLIDGLNTLTGAEKYIQ